MQAVYFHPQIQNFSFIFPIDCAVGTVWDMYAVRGKKLFSSQYLSSRDSGLTQLPLQWAQMFFSVGMLEIL